MGYDFFEGNASPLDYLKLVYEGFYESEDDRLCKTRRPEITGLSFTMV